MGHLRGQKGSQIAHFSKSDPSKAANLHREIISHNIFGTVTYLGQVENFDPFWGHPGRQMEAQKD